MATGSVRTIGRYEIEREIGGGGMAVVYKAFDPRLERAVAIKLIQSGAFGSNIFGHIRERFEREAKALAGWTARPSGTTGMGEIRTKLKKEPGTDSSVRFRKTDLQKVREVGSGGQTGTQPLQPVQSAR